MFVVHTAVGMSWFLVQLLLGVMLVLVSPLKAMQMSVVCAAAGSYADVHGLGCCQEPCWGLWPPQSMLRLVALADARGRVDVRGLYC